MTLSLIATSLAHTAMRHTSAPFPEMTSMIGQGLYSVSEASAYTSIPASDISRWLFGYVSARNGEKQHHPGLWRSELADITDSKALGFHDLLELRFVHAFRKHGVSLQAIRAASAHARELFEQAYPFTCTRFQTDGRSIFANVLETTRDETLLDLVKKQYVFKQVITPSLYDGIEYDQHGEADRWFPLPRSRSIVIDPARHFGQPIVTEIGIRTSALFEAWQAEGEDIRRVAKLYEVSAAAVEAAIRFEQKDLA